MRQFNLLVFDDWVPDRLADRYFSKISLAAPVGQVDQIAIQAVVDTCDATGGDLTIGVQHSGDGRNWVEKSTSTTAIGALPFSHVFVDSRAR